MKKIHLKIKYKSTNISLYYTIIFIISLSILKTLISFFPKVRISY